MLVQTHSTLVFLLSSRAILLTFFLLGCGVKGGPRPPENTMLPSVESRYLEVIKSPQSKDEDKVEDEKKKREGDKTKQHNPETSN